MYRWNINFQIGSLGESFTGINSEYHTICQELLEDIIVMLDRITDSATYRILDIIFVG